MEQQGEVRDLHPVYDQATSTTCRRRRGGRFGQGRGEEAARQPAAATATGTRRPPDTGRVRQALYPEKDVGRNWHRGGDAESQLARFLEPMSTAGVVSLLHDRRMPGSRANIDHIAVAPTGVWVIDSKCYSGVIKRDYRGNIFTGRYALTVHGRDRTSLVAAVERQREVVIDCLRDAGEATIPVAAVLCFVDGDWGWRLRPFSLTGVKITWPRALKAELAQNGPLNADARSRFIDRLAINLPPASSG